MRIILMILSGMVLLMSCRESPPPGESDSISDGEIESTIEEVSDTAESEDPLPAAEDIDDIILINDVPEGNWTTTMGIMEFSTDIQGYVNGVYPLGTIDGKLDGTVLEFTYSEGTLEGTGSFVFDEEFSSFQGLQDIAGTELIWNGQRL